MIDKLTELLKTTTLLKFSFLFQKEEEKNFINYSIKEKKIIVNITDPDDPNLGNMIDEKIKELQQLLN